MKNKFIFDENGQISDNDPIYIKLDEWHDNDEYDKILDTIYTIPHEQWSNSLWFRVISALNNKKQFDKARQELEKIKERCEKSRDISRYHYMLGYSYYMEDAEIMALSCFEKAVEADKSYTDEINLQNEIDKCKKYIDNSLDKLAEVAKSAVNAVSERIGNISESDRWTPEDDRFSLMLAYLPSIRKVPGLGKTLGIDDLFFKYEDDEKQHVRDWLYRFFNVTDKYTLKATFNRRYNFNEFFKDVKNYLSGNSSFHIGELNEDGLFSFNSCVKYWEGIIKYVPDGGIAAWDISERIGLARHAYACDLLSNSEYTSAVIAFTDMARELFSSWEEYISSLILGAGYFMFSISDFNVDEGINFMLTMEPLLLNSDICDANWTTEE